MTKSSFIAVLMMSLFVTSPVFAFQSKETAQYFNGPTISSVTANSATFSLDKKVLVDISDEEKSGVYFEYFETGKMCIAIYPTPAECLPKKTELGKTEVTVNKLTPGTSYTVTYKRDNTIRCITTPCPENGFTSLETVFVTKKIGDTGTVNPPAHEKITKNLTYRSRGQEVTLLQQMLIKEGYLTGEPTGYFGIMTFKAVKDFQKAHNITPVGSVGPLTRSALNMLGLSGVTTGEVFEGKISAFSTACFADAECSVTVDGKKVTITLGRKQGPVGALRGVESIGDLDKKIGATAKVYAKKTEDGYTLYGSADYYVEVR